VKEHASLTIKPAEVIPTSIVECIAIVGTTVCAVPTYDSTAYATKHKAELAIFLVEAIDPSKDNVYFLLYLSTQYGYCYYAVDHNENVYRVSKLGGGDPKYPTVTSDGHSGIFKVQNPQEEIDCMEKLILLETVKLYCEAPGGSENK